MQLAACFFLGCGIFLASGYNSFSKSMETIGKKQYQVQHGSCSYTFLLPEADNCRSSTPYVSNAVQRDAPLDYDDSVQRLQLLENIMENNTQWLMKVGYYNFYPRNLTSCYLFQCDFLFPRTVPKFTECIV